MRIIIIILSLICICQAAEPDLTGATFIADEQFVAWAKYAENKSSERGLNAVTMIAEAAARAGVEDYGKMVAVAWYESRFKTNALSKTGYYRGMFQIGKLHKKHMDKLDLDYYCEADRLYYGMLLFKDTGLKPWSTANRARRDYKKVMGVARGEQK